MILMLVFLVLAIVFLGIGIGSFQSVPYIVAGVMAGVALLFFNIWFLMSALFLHAAATRS